MENLEYFFEIFVKTGQKSDFGHFDPPIFQKNIPPINMSASLNSDCNCIKSNQPCFFSLLESYFLSVAALIFVLHYVFCLISVCQCPQVTD